MKILDTTLRDGSYLINFGFSAEDTRVVSKGLEDTGMGMIEVGHGIGLGASVKEGVSPAIESDEAYMKATAEVLTTAKWGMFAIVGIVTPEQIVMAKDHDMDFIRIGVSADEVEKARPYVEQAKKLGMYVAINFMKSYVLNSKEFALQVRLAENFGVDVAYLVDSAGNMLPSEIEEYVACIREQSELPLAFHGHNNLGLAMANALKCYELGLDIVDTSLQGMGRSAGNVATEHLVAVLEKKSVNHGIDLMGLMDLSEKHIRPRMQQAGVDSIDVSCGLAGFHSSYMGVIQKYSKKYNVDPRELIIEVCKINQSEAPEELVEIKAVELSKIPRRDSSLSLDHYFGNEQSEL